MLENKYINKWGVGCSLLANSSIRCQFFFLLYKNLTGRNAHCEQDPRSFHYLWWGPLVCQTIYYTWQVGVNISYLTIHQDVFGRSCHWHWENITYFMHTYYTQILSFHSRYRLKSASSTHYDLACTDRNDLVFLSFSLFEIFSVSPGSITARKPLVCIKPPNMLQYACQACQWRCIAAAEKAWKLKKTWR